MTLNTKLGSVKAALEFYASPITQNGGDGCGSFLKLDAGKQATQALATLDEVIAEVGEMQSQFDYLVKHNDLTEPCIGIVRVALVDGNIERAKAKLDYYCSKLDAIRPSTARKETV